jgi:hypothetical protein
MLEYAKPRAKVHVRHGLLQSTSTLGSPLSLVFRRSFLRNVALPLYEIEEFSRPVKESLLTPMCQKLTI